MSANAENISNGVVTVSTDKLEYQQMSTVGIVLTNNSGESIFSHVRSLTPLFCIKYIEKKTTEDQWEKLHAQCQFPNCTFEIDAPAEIKDGESVPQEWKPLVFIDGSTKTALLDPGVYRLVILYEDYQRKKWQTVYTNTFVIKSGRKK